MLSTVPLFHNDCPNLFLKLDTHAILVLPLPICCLNLTTGIPPPKSSPNNKGAYLYLELEKEAKKYFSTVLKKGTSLTQKNCGRVKKTAADRRWCVVLFFQLSKRQI